MEGVTGTFFHEQTPESLAQAVRRFDEASYDPAAIRAHAEQFDVKKFKAHLQAFIEQKMRI